MNLYILLLCMLNLLTRKIVSSQRPNLQLQDYCMQEHFQPQCGKNEVIVMNQAVYGRMKIGKCLEEDFFIGCSVNVLQLADKLCSGRLQCDIPIYNTQMREKATCLKKSLTAYFEASYYCQNVYSPRTNQCHSPTKLTVTKETVHIASITSTETSCGLHGTPWILEAKPGQQIDLHLIDFAWKNSSQNDNRCPVNYGYILDMENDDVINICGGDQQRDKQLLLSNGNSLQIVLESAAIENNNFLLHFKAVGCPDYNPPPHSWIQKENESLVIGCVSSDKTWKLKCVDNRWLGIVGNCTPPPTPTELVTSSEHNIVVKSGSSNKVPYVSNNHVVVFSLACITVVICCIIVILGIFCTKRYEVKIKKYKYNANNTISKDGRLTISRNGNTIYRPITAIPMGTMHPPAYTFPTSKDDRAPNLPSRTPSMLKEARSKKTDISGTNTGPHYDNLMDSQFTGGHYVNEDNESVQYYVLENPAESNNGGQGHEQMYQSINVENPFV